MSSYVVIRGDTFEAISRKVYGEESQALRIQQANPGVVEPLAIGATLTIPDELNTLTPTPLVDDGNPNEVSLLIDDKRFVFWDSMTIRQSIDSIDAVSFRAPFDSDNADFRETFRPFSYKPVSVNVGSSSLFTGVMLKPLPNLEPTRRSVDVSCYAKPGPLFDCPVPGSMLENVETDGLILREIAQNLASPFGVTVEDTTDGGAKFERVALEPGKKIGQFLTGLSKQRGFVLSATPRGSLLIQESVSTGSPVAILQQGAAPLVEVTPAFSPQQYYSAITGIDPVIIGNRGGSYSARNDFLNDVLRPFTFKVSDAEAGDIQKAAEAKLARMFADAASYRIQVSTWRDPSGNLWAPNTTLKLEAPDAMIYSSYEFLVRTVELRRVARRESATLELVLPGAFSGEQPESLPWV